MEDNKIYLMDCLKGFEQIDDGSIDLICTDPPYGISFKANHHKVDRFEVLKNDDVLLLDWLTDAYRVLKEDGAIYLFTRWDVLGDWKKAMEKAGFRMKSCIVWDRLVHGLGDLKGAYAPQHDDILFAVKTNKHKLRGKRPHDVIPYRQMQEPPEYNHQFVIRHMRPNPMKLVHPTQKPVYLVKKLIEKSTDKGDLVLDPFMGSGSTALACRMLDRRYLGFELDPVYYKVCQKRLSQTLEAFF